MFGLFKPKAGVIIDNFEKKAFGAWGVNSNNIATKLRFRAILGLYTSILMSTTINDRSVVERLSNNIFSKIIETVQDEKCRISDVFSVSSNVRCINFSQSKFLGVAGISSAKVITNGTGILDNIAQAFGEDCAEFLQDREDGEMLNAGLLLMKDITIGGFESGDLITEMQLAQDFLEFYEKMVKLVK